MYIEAFLRFPFWTMSLQRLNNASFCFVLAEKIINLMVHFHIYITLYNTDLRVDIVDLKLWYVQL